MVANLGFGQEEGNSKNWAIQANFQHQDLLIDIPFGQLGVYDQVNFRPVYSIEVQKYLKDKKRYRRFFSLQGYFYNNLYHDNSYGVQLGYFKERKIYKGLFVVSGMEIGIGEIQNSDPVYIYEENEWKPTENTSPAYTSVSFGPRLDIGYRILDKENYLDVILKSHLTLRLENRSGGLPFYGVGFGVRYGL